MRTWWNNLSNAFGCHWKHIDMWVGTTSLISCGTNTLTICFRNRQKSFEWAESVALFAHVSYFGPRSYFFLFLLPSRGYPISVKGHTEQFCVFETTYFYASEN